MRFYLITPLSHLFLLELPLQSVYTLTLRIISSYRDLFFFTYAWANQHGLLLRSVERNTLFYDVIPLILMLKSKISQMNCVPKEHISLCWLQRISNVTHSDGVICSMATSGWINLNSLHRHGGEVFLRYQTQNFTSCSWAAFMAELWYPWCQRFPHAWKLVKVQLHPFVKKKNPSMQIFLDTTLDSALPRWDGDVLFELPLIL